MYEEECTLKSRLSPGDEGEETAAESLDVQIYPTIDEDSSFKNIFDSGDDQALLNLNLTGLDHPTFNKLNITDQQDTTI